MGGVDQIRKSHFYSKSCASGTDLFRGIVKFQSLAANHGDQPVNILPSLSQSIETFSLDVARMLQNMNNDTLAKALFELLGDQQATIAKLLEQIDPTPPQETTSYAWLWWMFLFGVFFISVVLCVGIGLDCKVHQK